MGVKLSSDSRVRTKVTTKLITVTFSLPLFDFIIQHASFIFLAPHLCQAGSLHSRELRAQGWDMNKKCTNRRIRIIQKVIMS